MTSRFHQAVEAEMARRGMTPDKYEETVRRLEEMPGGRLVPSNPGSGTFPTTENMLVFDNVAAISVGAAVLLVEEMLRALKIDISGEHLKDTPERFVGMLQEMLTSPPIKWKTFPAPSDEMIVVDGIRFVSLCAHHLVPFMGVCHIAYVPKDEIAGLSKFARVVQHFSANLQVQENLTAQIATYLEENLKPRGVGVVMQAEHLCMAIRGAKSPGAITTTSAMKGVFSDHSRTAKAEFLAFINGKK